MNKLEALLFTGKCLTLGKYPGRISEVRDTISKGAVEWEKIVWTSTSHLVFPALYIQLERAGLLPLLPSDLVAYMEEFTSMNRDRNQQIIGQAKELTILLNRHGFSPVFLKGTAQLLSGLYTDIAERMVGDIDFLVFEKDLEGTAEVLLDAGYKPLYANIPENVRVQKHYSRLVKDERIAAVEIHHQVFAFPDNKLLDTDLIIPASRKLEIKGNAYIPCTEHQVIYNILNVQLSEKGFYYGRFRLSQLYDLLHLSANTDLPLLIENYGKSVHQLKSNLALANRLLGFPQTLPVQMSLREKYYVSRVVHKVNSPRRARFSESVLYFAMRFFNIFRQLGYSLFNQKMRKSAWRRMSDPTWYREHLRSYTRKKEG